jgi:hypothetical protein
MSLGNQLAQSAAMGALPTLYAAVAPGVNGGDYIGPTSMFGIFGAPGKQRSSQRSHDVALAQRLWQVSEALTGVRYEALEQRAAPLDRPSSVSYHEGHEGHEGHEA